MTTMERLEKRGILAWEFDGVLGRLTQAQSEAAKKSPLVLDVLQSLVKEGAHLAAKIRKRVVENGDLAGQRFPGYRSRGKVAVSVTYADQANADPGPWPWGPPDESRWRVVRGQDLRPTRIMALRVFANSADFHRAANTKAGSYSVTGGMWRGLQARGSGASSVILDFQGSSEGTGATERLRSYRPRSDRGKGVRSTTVVGYNSAKSRNSWKGGAIYDRHRVHVLLPKQDEIEGIAESLGAQYAGWMAKAIDS